MNAASHAEWSDPVLYGDLVLVGSAAGKALYALSRRDGSLVRTFPAENSVESGAVAVGDRVWFGDTGGNTYAYDLETGELLWQHDGNAPILVAPVVVPGDDGAPSRILVTNVDDLAIALDARTGELLWQYRAKRDLTRQAELTLYAAPRAEVADGLAVLGFSSGTVVGVDLETGEERWKRTVGEGRYPDIVADPVTVGNDLFTSGYYEPLVAIDLPSHNVRWRVDAGAAHAVAVDERPDGQVVLYHPGSDGVLRAVAALTGAQLWTWSSGSAGSLTTPIITDAGLLVASSESSIWLVDPDTGETVWRWHEPWMLQGISADPAVDGRQAVFVSNAGYLYSLIVPRPQPPPKPAWP
jgi:outer membrane protein assembly factor BamB